jgi:hypothetical protein
VTVEIWQSVTAGWQSFRKRWKSFMQILFPSTLDWEIVVICSEKKGENHNL